MQGRVTIQQGNRIHSYSNAIDADLYAYMTARISGDTDEALDNLFQKYVARNDADAVNKDGIIIQDNVSGDWFAIPTSVGDVEDNATRRFQGLFIPTSDITIQNLELGRSLNSSGDPKFDTMYATNLRPAPTTYFSAVPVLVTWDIKIARAV